MNIWWRRLQVLLCVGGGFEGFVVTIASALRGHGAGWLDLVLYLVFAGIFLYATIVGIVLSEQPERRGQLIFLYALQFITLYSPLLTYHCYCGLDLLVGVRGGGFIYDLNLGAGWQSTIFRPQSWGVGINLFAMLVVVVELIAWSRRRFLVTAIPS